MQCDTHQKDNMRDSIKPCNNALDNKHSMCNINILKIWNNVSIFYTDDVSSGRTC
jgi:hypothetical protein